jgi:hypothetical protein
MSAMTPTLGNTQVSPALKPNLVPDPAVTPNETRVAVIVTHGMGQQVPFETIEGVAQAIWKKAGDPANQPVIRSVRLGTAGKDSTEPEIVRAELVCADADKRSFHTHIYECYWAPITAGKVSLRDVVNFLFDSGWGGLLNAQARVCRRWMFDSRQVFNLKWPLLIIDFVIALLLVLSLVIMNAVVAAALTSRAIGTANAFPPRSLLSPLTSDFAAAEIGAFLIAIATVLLPWLFRRGANPRPLPRPVGWFAWLLVIIGGATILLAGLLIPFQLRGCHPESRLWPWLTNWCDGPVTSAAGAPPVCSLLPDWLRTLFACLGGGNVRVLLIWIVVVGATLVARWFLVEFAGDVVAYVSAHTVSKFFDIRQAIWKAAMRVAHAVYAARTADNSAFLYDKIIVVGHSLGSVISYDLLNGLLLEDSFSENSLSVTKRTRMLLTFGSPLDKTAFLFRSQTDQNSLVREVGAAAVQPLVADYANRPKEWINLYSPSDIISGALDYYDDANNESNGGTRRIKNLLDEEARTPLAAHVEYWTGDLLASTLVRGITTP